MISVKTNIEFSRGNFLLKLDCEFNSGVTGIFGPSGAGKTSLLHLIAGMERPHKGEIVVAGKVMVSIHDQLWVPVQRRRVGYVFQEGRLFPHLSVKKNLTFGMHFLKPSQQKIDFDDVVDLLEIEALLDKNPNQLSGGQQQRVAIGRALLSSPQLLLMDEPFSSLDMALRGQIIPYLNRITRQLQIPMLVVSHDLPDLLSLTPQLMLMNKGQMVGHGHYFDLIAQDHLLDIMQGAGLINMIHFKVESHDVQNGLTRLSKKVNDHYIRVVCNMGAHCCKPGEEISVSLRPEDIAITLNTVENISVRNQLKGHILEIIHQKNITYCIVDVGFKLMVVITEASRIKMNLHVGKTVWCLFKSMALKMNR